MVREFSRTKARSCVVFETLAVVLALAAPLLISNAGQTPASAGVAAGVAALALALCGLVALGRRGALLSGHVVATQLPRWTDPRPGRTADVTNPPHHPLRPRAPGSARRSL